MAAQRIRELEGRYVLELSDVSSAPPAAEDWLALVRAPDGLTVVRRARAGGGEQRWVALFSGDSAHGADVPGMLAALLVPLAAAAIPVFVASTHGADVVLVPEKRVQGAAAALRAAGHDVAVEGDA